MPQQYIINNRLNGNRTVVIQQDPYLTGWNGPGYGFGTYGWGGRSLWGSRYVYNNPIKTIVIQQPTRNQIQNIPNTSNIPIGRPLQLQRNKKNYLEIPIKQQVQKQNSFENYVVSTSQSTKLYQCEGYSKQSHKLLTISFTNSQFCNVNLNYLSKLKIKVGSSYDTFHTLKLVSAEKQYFYFFKMSDLEQIFTRIFWVRMCKLKYFSNVQKKGIVSGIIFKKSQFLGQWEERYVTIDCQGLKSSLNRWQQATVIINSIKQLWTRFQIVKLYQSIQAYHVVIKLWHKWIKYQFAVSVQDFVIWIRGFCQLIRNKTEGK